MSRSLEEAENLIEAEEGIGRFLAMRAGRRVKYT
jgi:hypothetical protein